MAHAFLTDTFQLPRTSSTNSRRRAGFRAFLRERAAASPCRGRGLPRSASACRSPPRAGAKDHASAAQLRRQSLPPFPAREQFIRAGDGAEIWLETSIMGTWRREADRLINREGSVAPVDGRGFLQLARQRRWRPSRVANARLWQQYQIIRRMPVEVSKDLPPGGHRVWKGGV